ncbi:uncharacterized protein LOC141754134 [Sebastes fasciatus]|uniref:uncharacterized protein LOC141754134 n=1 Tax=Sebastes fasciatus TaxID=394691 RepID=UPI003D9E8C8A
MDRHRKQLEVVLKPEAKPRGEVLPLDVRKVIVGEEERQEWRSSLDQDDPEPPHIKEEQEDPEPPHIKEEQEDLWTSQEGEQLQGLEEADIIKFPFTPVSVKSEEDEENPQLSQLYQRQTEKMETEADGEDCGGPEPARNSDLNIHPEPIVIIINYVVPVSDSRCSSGEKPFSCSECDKRFGTKTCLNRHMRSHKGEKPFICSVCRKSFIQSGHLQLHMRIHTGEKPFICPVCGKRFIQKAHLTHHMAVHTGERLFSCSVCNKRFAWRRQIKKHKCVGRQSSQLHQTQTEENREAERPASSSTKQMKKEADGEDCGGPEPARNSESDRRLQQNTVETDDSDDWKETRGPQSGLNSLNNDEVPVSDSRCSTGEKTFSCSECDKRFGFKKNLKRHMRTHTGEKPFSCSFCMKSFARRGDLQKHMRIHTGEKPFSCSVCMKSFTQSVHLQSHMKVHTVA